MSIMVPPPTGFQSNLPVLNKAVEAYKLWHRYHGDFPRLSRYTLGQKIDSLFTDLIERILLAGYAVREQKQQTVAQASVKLDALKFFLQVAWELKYLDHKIYSTLSTPLFEIGKMIGGWQRDLKDKRPPPDGRGP